MLSVYTATVFVSAFLPFLVQPLIAKQILPWFGGSAGRLRADPVDHDFNNLFQAPK